MALTRIKQVALDKWITVLNLSNMPIFLNMSFVPQAPYLAICSRLNESNLLLPIFLLSPNLGFWYSTAEEPLDLNSSNGGSTALHCPFSKHFASGPFWSSPNIKVARIT